MTPKKVISSITVSTISRRSQRTPDKVLKHDSPPQIKEVETKKEKKRIQKESFKSKAIESKSKGNGSYFWNNQLH